MEAAQTRKAHRQAATCHRLAARLAASQPPVTESLSEWAILLSECHCPPPSPRLRSSTSGWGWWGGNFFNFRRERPVTGGQLPFDIIMKPSADGSGKGDNRPEQVIHQPARERLMNTCCGIDFSGL